jgi:hypothetical protein
MKNARGSHRVRFSLAYKASVGLENTHGRQAVAND